MKKSPFIIAALLLGSAGVALSQLQTAGTLLVDLDASTYSNGDPTWSNSGTLNDFTTNGDPVRLDDPGGSQGVAIYLDGAGDFFQQDGTAPASITGSGDRSIEAWVWNPSIPDEETVVSWGHRGGPDGTNWSANYGSHGTWGALGGWGGAADMPFQNTGAGAPPAQEWHHLAWTYDSATNTRSIYVNGVLSNSENDGTINTHVGTSILVGAQWADASTVEGALQGSLAVGRVRVHDGVLSPGQVTNNYNELSGDFVSAAPPAAPVPAPLNASPVNRYSFNEIGGSGTTLVDSIGGADGTIVEGGANDGSVGIISSGMVTLAGGVQAESDWVQMPGGLVSGYTDATIEIWATQHDVQNWSRVFSVGDNPDSVMHMAFTSGTDANANELRWNDVPGGNNGQANNFGGTPPNPDEVEVHWLVSIDDDGGLLGDTKVTIYKDGAEVASFETASDLSGLNDTEFFLGRSQWGDNTASASWNELRIYDYALNQDEALGNFQAGPDALGIPEPGVAALVGLVGAAALFRRRRH